MLTVSIFLLLLAAGGAYLAWRFRLLPVKSGTKAGVPGPRMPPSPRIGHSDDVPATNFLPAPFETDELEADDLQWLLARQRNTLEKEERTHLQRESAARFEELGDQLDALESRVQALQRRMEDWKGALLGRESLQLAYQQLQNDHLDQQYVLESLREERERLQAELAGARKESLLDYEENQQLRKQLALLRNLTRED